VATDTADRRLARRSRPARITIFGPPALTGVGLGCGAVRRCCDKPDYFTGFVWRWCYSAGPEYPRTGRLSYRTDVLRVVVAALWRYGYF
jgi:hypothetical protein